MELVSYMELVNSSRSRVNSDKKSNVSETVTETLDSHYEFTRLVAGEGSITFSCEKLRVTR
jgi:hypothetical protein